MVRGRAVSPSWLRILSAALPTAAVVTAAIVFLGPGKPRAALGARVWGSPLSLERAPLAVRIEGIRRLYGVDDAAAPGDMRALSLDVRDASGAALGLWSGDAGPDGVAEALVSAASARGPLDVRVRRGDVLLAEGRIERRSQALEGIVRGSGDIGGVSRGDRAARVEVVRGQMVAPFEEEVRVTVLPGEGAPFAEDAAGEVSIEASPASTQAASGVEVRPPRATAGRGGSATFWVKPTAYNVELSLKIHDTSGHQGEWEGNLPVVPGAMWLDPSGQPGEITIVSPAPRERAYTSFYTEGGRVFGAVIPLARDEAGFYRGRLATPADLLAAKDLRVVVAGDAYERGVGTVAWPIAPPEGKAPLARVELLIDGMPAAEAREKARAGSARTVGVLVIGLAAALEVLLLLIQSRASQRRLVAHFEEAQTEAGERERLLGAAKDRPLVGALIGAALIVLAFALVLAFVALR